MTLKMLLFNKSLLINIGKRFWWASALYFLALFFDLPLKHLMLIKALDFSWPRDLIRNTLFVKLDYYSDPMLIQLLLLSLAPVIIAALVFRYMQDTGATTMMHSLPCNKKELYINHCAAGFVLLFVPLVLTGLVLMAIQSTTVLKEVYSLMEVLNWMGISLLFLGIFYSSAVFVGMFTGNSIAHIVFYYILHILPAGFSALFHFNAEQLIYGFSSNYHYSFIDYLPLFKIFEPASLGGVYKITCLTLTLLFLAAAFYVYKLRHAEVAGNIIAFKSVRPVFKYGVTICTMLLGGAYFSPNYIFIIFGYMVSASIGYWVAEMLMEKSFNVWNSAYKGYLAYILLLIVGLTAIKVDATGYVNRVPEPEQVKQAHFEFYGERYNYYFENNAEQITIEDAAGIQHVIDLHRALLQKPCRTYGSNSKFVYILKDGTELNRKYYISNINHASVLAPLYDSNTYKQHRFPILKQELEEIKLIELYDTRAPFKRPHIISDPEEISKFKILLHKELQEVTYDELIVHEYGPTIKVVNYDKSEHYYNLRSGYTSLITWLKEKSIYEKAILLPEEIEYAILRKGHQVVEIRNPNVIHELLSQSSHLHYDQDAPLLHATFYRDSSDIFTHEFLPPANPSEELENYIFQLGE